MNRYFSIDCEFSGLDHTKYDLISTGIVEIQQDENKQFFVNKNRTFYIELKPLHKEFDVESMKINGLNFSNLYQYGSEPKEACRQITKYLDLKEDDTAVFIGYCNTLDKIYVDQLFLAAKFENPFHYETIEISSLAMGVLKLDWGFEESELERLLNMSPMEKSEKHNAKYDALHQGEQFCRLMNYR